VKAGVIDAKAMEKYFENSEIILRSSIFKRGSLYINIRHADVLNQKPESLQVTAAKGRIFTLKMP
jgi:hypothetical protein